MLLVGSHSHCKREPSLPPGGCWAANCQQSQAFLTPTSAGAALTILNTINLTLSEPGKHFQCIPFTSSLLRWTNVFNPSMTEQQQAQQWNTPSTPTEPPPRHAVAGKGFLCWLLAPHAPINVTFLQLHALLKIQALVPRDRAMQNCTAPCELCSEQVPAHA